MRGRSIHTFGNNYGQVVILEYPDSPRYQVELYYAHEPGSRTLILTDALSEAKKVFNEAIWQHL